MFEVGKGLGGFGSLSGLGEDREEDGGENSDDGYDDKEFYERESSVLFNYHSVTLWVRGRCSRRLPWGRTNYDGLLGAPMLVGGQSCIGWFLGRAFGLVGFLASSPLRHSVGISPNFPRSPFENYCKCFCWS